MQACYNATRNWKQDSPCLKLGTSLSALASVPRGTGEGQCTSCHSCCLQNGGILPPIRLAQVFKTPEPHCSCPHFQAAFDSAAGTHVLHVRFLHGGAFSVNFRREQFKILYNPFDGASSRLHIQFLLVRFKDLYCSTWCMTSNLN
jgi:hypothetical protein